MSLFDDHLADFHEPPLPLMAEICLLITENLLTLLRGFLIHVYTVGTCCCYRQAVMGEKIANQSFPLVGAVGSVLELILGDLKLFPKSVTV